MIESGVKTCDLSYRVISRRMASGIHKSYIRSFVLSYRTLFVVAHYLIVIMRDTFL